MQDSVQIACRELIPDLVDYHQLPVHLNTPLPPKQQLSITMANAELCRYEEYGTLWLWAYPALLGWTRQICWLFSPVVGKDRFPGDLWGVDSEGDLILVETKLARKPRGHDPFGDFIDFDRCFLREATLLRQRWRKLLEGEKTFLERHRRLLQDSQTERRTLPGVVPYSSKRFVVWRWRHIYLNVIMPQLLANSYEVQGEAYLAKYAASATPSPHYFGVIVVAPDVKPSLSSKGQDNYQKLCQRTGEDHVHLRYLRALYLGNDVVQIESKAAQPHAEVP